MMHKLGKFELDWYNVYMKTALTSSTIYPNIYIRQEDPVSYSEISYRIDNYKTLWMSAESIILFF